MVVEQSKAAVVWQERLRRFEESELSVKEFCARESVSDPSFYQWRKRLGGAESSRSRRRAKPAFQPVRVTGVTEALSVEFPGGVQLHVPTSDLNAIRAVVSEVATACRADAAGGR